MTGTSWLQKVCNNTKLYTIMSKGMSLCNKITSKVCYNVEKYVIMSKSKSRNMSWDHKIWKVYHDVKIYVIKLKESLLWHQNTSWHQKVHHDVKTYHETKNMSWRKIHIMTSKRSSWCQKYAMTTKKFVMM